MSDVFRTADARCAVLERQAEFLDRWPEPRRQRIVPTRHGDTFVVDCGDQSAPAVVLVHGAGFNSAAWTPDVAAWTTTHRVFAVDVIGEPGRSAGSRPLFEGDAYTRWLDDVLDEVGVDRAAFVGTSLGGWIALDHAIRRPDRVSRLAALVPAGIGRQKYRALLTALLLMPFGRRGRRAGMSHVLGPRPSVPSDAGGPVMQGTGDDLTAEFDDYLWLIQTSYRPRRDRLPIFTDEQLAALAVPLLVIAGAQDRLLDAHDTARRLHALRPDATVVVLPDTGHIPTGTTGEIHRFLTDDEQR